jgi:hypothetical protein
MVRRGADNRRSARDEAGVAGHHSDSARASSNSAKDQYRNREIGYHSSGRHGPHPHLHIYRQNPTTDLAVRDSEANNYHAPLESFFNFEWRRGSILRPEEQPIVVGVFIVEEQLHLRENSFAKWSHSKRGFDWQRVILAASIAGFSVLIYLLARAFGWIIDGFTSGATD